MLSAALVFLNILSPMLLLSLITYLYNLVPTGTLRTSK